MHKISLIYYVLTIMLT